MLKTEIVLFKYMANTSNDEKNKCSVWVNRLTEFNYKSETIFCNIGKALKMFMVIPVTNWSYERTFSKLSIIKTKLCGIHRITWMTCSQYSLRNNMYIM